MQGIIQKRPVAAADFRISDLLPIDEPDVDAYEKAPLHFQYHYDILPSGIISRFIVRNHTLIHKTMRWRSGVVLKLDSSRALVRADEEDNTISIKAQGPRASALLTTIRTDFAKLHPNLAVQEFLIVRELIENQPTGREVPVDYTYLCELEKDNTLEAKLPRLKGKYNIPNLLNGVESRTDRQTTLNDRQNLSRRTRTDRPLLLLNDRPKRPTLLKTSALMLVILATVAAIFTVIAHTVPGLNFAITCMAILLAFAGIGIFVLRVTGIIDNNTFQETLDSFLNAVPLLKGKDSDKADNNDRKSIPESDDETLD